MAVYTTHLPLQEVKAREHFVIMQEHSYSSWLLLLLLLVCFAAAAVVACRPPVARAFDPSLIFVCLQAPVWAQPFFLRLRVECWPPVPGMDEVFWVQRPACERCCTLQPRGAANFVEDLQQASQCYGIVRDTLSLFNTVCVRADSAGIFLVAAAAAAAGPAMSGSEFKARQITVRLLIAYNQTGEQLNNGMIDVRFATFTATHHRVFLRHVGGKVHFSETTIVSE
jgi:hypothetical protein